MLGQGRNREPGSPRPQVQESSVDRLELLAWLGLRALEREVPLLKPVFQACCLSRNHSVALGLVHLVAEHDMLGASPEVIEDTLNVWVCVIHRHLNDHARSVDFLARLLDLNLDIQEGRVNNLGLGYNAVRSSHVWAPRPFVGPRRRVLGTVRTRALPRLQLRGGNNGGGGNGAGFAGVVEAGFAGIVEEVGSGEVVGEVKEVGSDDLDVVLRSFDAEDTSGSVLKALD
jgi:hypothetical protein